MIAFILQWQVLVVPFAVMIISQVIKTAIDYRARGFQWRALNSYGGMPSSHTALFVSLTIMVGFVEGFASPLFAAIAFISAVFIRDAVGIRWSLGFHGQVLNHIIANLPEQEQKQFPKHLEERLGHRPVEVVAGGIVGLALTMLWIMAFGQAL